MAYIETWNNATPAAGANVSEGDDRIRELKRAIDERLATVFDGWPGTDPLTVKSEALPSGEAGGASAYYANYDNGTPEMGEELDDIAYVIHLMVTGGATDVTGMLTIPRASFTPSLVGKSIRFGSSSMRDCSIDVGQDATNIYAYLFDETNAARASYTLMAPLFMTVLVRSA